MKYCEKSVEAYVGACIVAELPVLLVLAGWQRSKRTACETS